MLGFMIKDLAMIKSNSMLLMLIAILYVVVWLVSGDIDLAFILPFMCVMIMITTFSYDNYNKWDAYAASLPNGRKNSVRAKYLMTVLLVVVISLVTAILSAIIQLIKLSAVDYLKICVTLLGAILATLMVLALMYPAIYKFGIEKARIGVFVIVFGIVIIGGLVSRFVDFSVVASALSPLKNYLLPIATATVIIIVFVSYLISARVAERKEF